MVRQAHAAPAQHLAALQHAVLRGLAAKLRQQSAGRGAVRPRRAQARGAEGAGAVEHDGVDVLQIQMGGCAPRPMQALPGQGWRDKNKGAGAPDEEILKTASCPPAIPDAVSLAFQERLARYSLRCAALPGPP